MRSFRQQRGRRQKYYEALFGAGQGCVMISFKLLEVTLLRVTANCKRYLDTVLVRVQDIVLVSSSTHTRPTSQKPIPISHARTK
jgi:hypothetical protein